MSQGVDTNQEFMWNTSISDYWNTLARKAESLQLCVTKLVWEALLEILSKQNAMYTLQLSAVLRPEICSSQTKQESNIVFTETAHSIPQ